MILGEIESDWVDRKFLDEFKLGIKKIIGGLERIIIKENRYNMCILFNETCLNIYKSGH